MYRANAMRGIMNSFLKNITTFYFVLDTGFIWNGALL